MLRKIVFGLVSMMGVLCAGQTLYAQVACLVSIEPKACKNLLGVWPGLGESPFACNAVLCGATVPLHTLGVAPLVR
jgi:hypothetical protein